VAYSGGGGIPLTLAYARLMPCLDRKCWQSLPILPAWPRSQFERCARFFAREHGIPFARQSRPMELERERVCGEMDPIAAFTARTNSSAWLEQELERTGFEALAYGLNLDDGQDFRPGPIRRPAQHRVAAPLAEAGTYQGPMFVPCLNAPKLRVWE